MFVKRCLSLVFSSLLCIRAQIEDASKAGRQDLYLVLTSTLHMVHHPSLVSFCGNYCTLVAHAGNSISVRCQMYQAKIGVFNVILLHALLQLLPRCEHCVVVRSIKTFRIDQVTGVLVFIGCGGRRRKSCIALCCNVAIPETKGQPHKVPSLVSVLFLVYICLFL